jgi:hypothetical protein
VPLTIALLVAETHVSIRRKKTTRPDPAAPSRAGNRAASFMFSPIAQMNALCRFDVSVRLDQGRAHRPVMVSKKMNSSEHARRLVSQYRVGSRARSVGRLTQAS